MNQQHERVGADEVLTVFSGQLRPMDRLLYPHNAVDDIVLGAFRRLREGGRRIVLVDGSFDVPHPSHEWYLRHCKYLGAKAVAADTRQALEDGLVALAVTVDADEKLARIKSGVAAKGGVQRPIYPWQTRADRVAGYYYELGGKARPVADLVTVEGDSLHRGTLLESSLLLAHGLSKKGLLDDLVVYGEHTETIKEARRMEVNPLVISDDIVYDLNPQTNERWSSSGIINRAQGAAAPYPVTRPGDLRAGISR
jgi:hypothetical protein